MNTLQTRGMAMADPTEVVHRPEVQRFEALVDGQRCELDYMLSARTMRIHHTGVPPSLQGRGIAAALAAAALAEARRQGWRVHPVCSYVRSYMRRHPETQDLLETP
jgi:predicted GNAT family acetyltransferase